MASIKCKECGCMCPKCTLDHDVHLHAEIENLKQQLVEKHNHIVTMETNFLNEANKYPNGELLALHDELLTWQDKYKRLYDAHRRIQRVNQGLEDKLLRLVDVSETDKSTLTKDVATLSFKLAEANYTIKKLTEDNERYKNDVSIAIQFLQCKPGNFVSQKFDTLPNEVQAKVSTYMGGKRKTDEKKAPPEIKSIKVPIPTFPPTAMVYSVPKSQAPLIREEKETEGSVDIVSAAIMAKVLEERTRERSCVKHCDTCTCSNHLKIIHNSAQHSIATQTQTCGASGESLCLQCNNKVERASSIQLVKGVSSAEQTKNKAMPVYIHDYNESCATANSNVAKVQPNNFLNDSTDCNKLRKEAMDSTTKLGTLKVKSLAASAVLSPPSGVEHAVNETHDLIDLQLVAPSTANSNDNEILYFANERSARKSHQVQTHECNSLVSPPLIPHIVRAQTQPLLHQTPRAQTTHLKVYSQQSQLIQSGLANTNPMTNAQNMNITPQSQQDIQCETKSLLLDTCADDYCQMMVSTSTVPQFKASSLSSRDQSELTSKSSGPTNTSSATSCQRVEDWMDSINLIETAAIENSCGTDCSESLRETSSFLPSSDSLGAGEKIAAPREKPEKGRIDLGIDPSKYKEMEDHVKKFLLGEYTLLSDVNKNDYD